MQIEIEIYLLSPRKNLFTGKKQQIDRLQK